MVSENIEINVVANDVDQLQNVSIGLRNIVLGMNQAIRVTKNMDARQRGLDKALGLTTKGLDEHAKSLREAMQNSVALSQASAKTAQDIKKLKTAMAFGRGGPGMGTVVKDLQNVEKALNKARPRALVSDLRSVAVEIKRLGKDAQFVGRSLIIGLTTPILTFGSLGLNYMYSLEKQITRLNKLLGDARNQVLSEKEAAGFQNLGIVVSDVTTRSEALEKTMKSLSVELGISRDLLTAITGDFAELGLNQADVLASLTKTAAELSVLGNMDVSVAQELSQTMFLGIMRTFDLRGRIFENAAEKQATAANIVKNQIYMFNAVENATAMSFQDIAQALPELSAASISFGLSFMDAIALLAPMKAAGIDVAVGANSIKMSLQRMVSPTNKARKHIRDLSKEFGALNPDLEEAFLNINEIGTTGIQGLVDATGALMATESGQARVLDLYTQIFGKHQATRMLISTQNMVSFQNEMRSAGTQASFLTEKFNQTSKSIAQSAGSNYIAINSIQDLMDTAKLAAASVNEATGIIEISGKAYTQADIDAAKAARKSFQDYIKSELDKGNNVIEEITNEAGKTLFINLAGAASAMDLANRELEIAKDSISVTIDRIKISFKELTVQFINEVKPLLEGAANAFNRLVEILDAMDPRIKKAILGFLAFVASIGPLVFIMGQVRLAFGVAFGTVLKFVPGLRNLTIEAVASNTAMLRLRDGLVLSGDAVINNNSRFSTFIATLASGNGPISKLADKFGRFAGILRETSTASSDVIEKMNQTTITASSAMRGIAARDIGSGMQGLSEATSAVSPAGLRAKYTSQIQSNIPGIGQLFGPQGTTPPTNLYNIIDEVIGEGDVQRFRVLKAGQLAASGANSQRIANVLRLTGENIDEQVSDLIKQYEGEAGKIKGALPQALAKELRKAGIGKADLLEVETPVKQIAEITDEEFQDHMDKFTKNLASEKAKILHQSGIKSADVRIYRDKDVLRQHLDDFQEALAKKREQILTNLGFGIDEVEDVAQAGLVKTKSGRFKDPTTGKFASSRQQAIAKTLEDLAFAEQQQHQDELKRLNRNARIIRSLEQDQQQKILDETTKQRKDIQKYNRAAKSWNDTQQAKRTVLEQRINDARAAAHKALEKETIELGNNQVIARNNNKRNQSIRDRINFDLETARRAESRERQAAIKQLREQRKIAIDRMKLKDPFFERAGISREGTALAFAGEAITESQADLIAQGGRRGRREARRVQGGPRLGRAGELTQKALRAPIAIARAPITVVKSPFKAYNAGAKLAKNAVKDLADKNAAFGKAAPGAFQKAATAAKALIGGFSQLIKLAKIAKFAFMSFGITAVIIGAVLAVKFLIDNFDKIRTQAAPGIEALKKTFEVLKNTLFALLQPILDLIQSFSSMGGEGGDAVGSIASAFNRASEQILSFAKSIQSFIQQYIVPIVYTIVNIIRNVTLGIFRTVKGIIKFIKGIIEIFKGDWKKGLTLIWEGSKDTFMGILRIIGALVSGGIELFVKFASGVVDLYASMVAGLIRLMGSFIASAVNGFGTLADKVSGFFDFIPGISKTNWGKAGESVRGFFDTVANGVQSGIGSVSDAISSIGDSVVSFIRDITDNDKVVEGSGKKFWENWSKGGTEATTEVSDELEEMFVVGSGGAEDMADDFKDALTKAIKEVQQRFVDLVLDGLSANLNEAVDSFTEALEKQRDSALDVYDQQLETIEKLEKAEESLLREREYIAERKKQLDERELQRQNYVRNRALAIYEGRIDDARMLDLEERKSRLDSAKSIQDLDQKRNADLAKENLDFIKEQIKKTKEESDKFFKEQIDAFKEAAKEITKFAPTTIEEYEKQLKQLTALARKTANENGEAFSETFQKMTETIQTDLPNIGAGVFSTNLQTLVDIARQKYGLESPTENSIVGATVAMLGSVSQAVQTDGLEINSSMEDILDQLTNDVVKPALVEINTIFKDKNPQKILAEVIADANMTIQKEFERTVGHVASLVDSLAAQLDPYITKIVEAQTALETLRNAAAQPLPSPSGGAGGAGGAGGVGSAGQLGNISKFHQAELSRELRKTTSSQRAEDALRRLNITDLTSRNAFRSKYMQSWNIASTLIDPLAFKNWIDTQTKNMGYKPGWLTEIENDWMSTYNSVMFKYTIGPGIFANGGLVKKLQYGGSMVPGFASQGVPAILHGGEYVINSKAVSNIGLAALQSLNNMRFTTPGRFNNQQAQSVTTQTHNYNIYVDNFIGEDAWFESMMKEYNMKVVPKNQKNAGLQSRTISTYSGVNRGM